MAVKQTAGRDALGEFAPKFAELNDDVLFGQVWSREEQLSLRDAEYTGQAIAQLILGFGSWMKEAEGGELR